MGSIPTLGSSGAGGGFQLGQQHLMMQDVEEMMQRSISTHPSDVPSNPGASEPGQIAAEAELGAREHSVSPARPRQEPHSQHTPTHSDSFNTWGVPGRDLPGCIPDTPSGSEGLTGQQQRCLLHCRLH
jgi:hypothetical protein